MAGFGLAPFGLTPFGLDYAPTPGGSIFATRLVAYAPNGASLGPLPAPQGYQASYPLGDVGALALDYALAAPRASLLGKPVEVALEVSHDGGHSWQEPPDSRFLYLKDGADPLDLGQGVIKAGCPAYVWVLGKAYVGTQSLGPDGKRHLNSQNAGQIMRTLITEAQARGALAGLTMMTWNGATDSAGQAWDKIITLAYDPTLTLLPVLLNLVDQGLVEFQMVGRDLRLYRTDNGTGTGALSPDRSTGSSPVVLRYGRDLVEAPFTRTWEGLASDVLLVGDQGVFSTRSNPTANLPWGRWETTITQGGVSDPGTQAVLSDAALAKGADPRQELTSGLAFRTALSLPFRDYTPGAYVLRDTGDGTGPQRLRVRQVTLTSDGQNVAGNVVLGDRFLEADVRLARRVQGITGGSGAEGGTGARPVPPTVTDTVAPSPVANLGLTATAYLDAAGVPRSLVVAAWDAPTTNADGSPLTDLAGYRLRYRQVGQAAWTAGGVIPAGTTTAALSGLTPGGANLVVSVQAYDRDGNASTWVDSASTPLPGDPDPPAIPSTPTATPYLGVVRVTWDGLASTGGAMPVDLAAVEVHQGTSTGFTPTAATMRDRLLPGGGTAILSGTYGTPLFVRLVAVDTTGNRSTASATATATPVRAADGDLSSLAVGKLLAGSLVADVTLSARIKTADTGARVELNALGLQAYNASGQQTLGAASADGSLTAVGIYRTAFSGARAELGTDSTNRTSIVFYDDLPTTVTPASLASGLAANGKAQEIVLGGPAIASFSPGYLRLAGNGASSVAELTNGAASGTQPSYLSASGTRATVAAGWTTTVPDGGTVTLQAVQQYDTAALALKLVYVSGAARAAGRAYAVQLAWDSLSVGAALRVFQPGSTGQASRPGLEVVSGSSDPVTPTYQPLRASAFTVSSDRAAKHDEADARLGGLEAVRTARVKRWRRKGTDEHQVGLMANDLPAALQHDVGGGQVGYSVTEVLALLWEAMQDLDQRMTTRKA